MRIGFTRATLPFGIHREILHSYMHCDSIYYLQYSTILLHWFVFAGMTDPLDISGRWNAPTHLRAVLSPLVWWVCRCHCMRITVAIFALFCRCVQQFFPLYLCFVCNYSVSGYRGRLPSCLVQLVLVKEIPFQLKLPSGADHISYLAINNTLGIFREIAKNCANLDHIPRQHTPIVCKWR